LIISPDFLEKNSDIKGKKEKMIIKTEKKPIIVNNNWIEKN